MPARRLSSQVHVISGRDKGKQGIVQEVVRKKNSVVVEGLNLVRPHVTCRMHALELTFSCLSSVSVVNASRAPRTGKGASC